MQKTGLYVTQIGANTKALVGTLRLFYEAFGFVSAGGNGLWGETLALHGLPPKSAALHWFMVGAQKYFHLEFLHHTSPRQRRKRRDWKPSDHGWNRFGVAVTDFDASLRTLELHRISTITPPIMEGGLRRVAFIEPFIQVIVEVLRRIRQAADLMVLKSYMRRARCRTLKLPAPSIGTFLDSILAMTILCMDRNTRRFGVWATQRERHSLRGPTAMFSSKS